jgi:FAD/FMN-containing dehydrogenase
MTSAFPDRKRKRRHYHSFKIIELCIEQGGSITGEHGVGEEKKMMMGRMFAEPDLETMQRVRCAFDPLQLANPTKVFPRPRLCGDKPGEYTSHPLGNCGGRGALLKMLGDRFAETDPLAGVRAEALGSIVGADHVRLGEINDAVAGVPAQIVVEPGNEKEVALVLRWANKSGLVVVPRGGGTKLSWGNPPARVDLMASVTRLNLVEEHDWADLTVTVEAGCTIQNLREQLARHGQRLALDVLWPQRATIGGMLPTNDSDALRLHFGGLRDLITGITLVLPDGTLASRGGKVV